MDFVYYFLKDPKATEITGSYKLLTELYGIADTDFDNSSRRTDADLVAVVEELGDEASDRYAGLRVYEIPDDCKYEISDYDGIETATFGYNLGTV